MGDISKEQALEAYNLIRDYCKQHDNCENCSFLHKDGEEKSYCSSEPCIFGVGFYPCDWD